MGVYPWSRFIDSTSEVFPRDGTNSILTVPLFQGGLQLDRGLSLFDRTHRLVISYIWELPRPRSGILGSALGGWRMAGVTTLQSGNPYTIMNGFDRNADGNTSDRRDVGNPDAPRNTRCIVGTTSPTGYINPDTGMPVARNEVYVVQGAGFPDQKRWERTQSGPSERTTSIGRSSRTFGFVKVLSWSIDSRLSISLTIPQFFEVPPNNVVTSVPGAFGNYNLVDGTSRDIKMGLKLIWWEYRKGPTFDGSGVTFISDSSVQDFQGEGGVDRNWFVPMATSYCNARWNALGIIDGKVRWIRDRYGNRIEFSPPTCHILEWLVSPQNRCSFPA
jgi:hypothetical protein